MNRTLKWILTAALVASTGGTALAHKKHVKATKLVLKVAPPDTEIWVDGQKKGTADKVTSLELKPGTHNLDFKHKGDEHTDQVTLKKGATTTFQWKFEDDRPKNDNDGMADPVELRTP